jgi:hypothetical protein
MAARSGDDRVGVRSALSRVTPVVFGRTVSGQAWQASYSGGQTVAAGAGGALFLGPLLMIMFRRKYPRWWFDWNLELGRFSSRVSVYLALMDDRYPSTDDHQSVHLDYPYPDAARDLSRWLPLVKWLAAIPHYVVLLFLYIAAFAVVIMAWFAIVFTAPTPGCSFPREFPLLGTPVSCHHQYSSGWPLRLRSFRSFG